MAKTTTAKKLPEGWKKHRKFEPLSYGVMGYSDEYLCPHGIGHDAGVHGCDGCCGEEAEIFDILLEEQRKRI